MEPNNDLGIKFEEDKYKQAMPSFTDETPGIIRLVIKWSGGAIKDQCQAEYVLLGFVILAIIISLFLFFRNSGSGANPLPYEATYKTYQ